MRTFLLLLVLLILTGPISVAQTPQRVHFTNLDPPISCIPSHFYNNPTLPKAWEGKSDGTCVRIDAAAAVSSPGGSDTQVQFNDATAFGGDAGFTYNKTTDAVSVNGGVLAVTAGTGDIGSATKPFGFVFLSGSSGTPGTNNFKFIGASTSGTRTVTLPDANTLIPIATQTLTFAGPSTARTITFPDAAITVARTDAGNTFTGHQTVEGVTSTGATGTGKFVFDTAPTFVTSVSAPVGSLTSAGYQFAAIGSGAGMAYPGSGGVSLIDNGSASLTSLSGDVYVRPGAAISWSATGSAGSSSGDTALNRVSAGVVGVHTAIGAGSAGSIKALAYLTNTNCADSAGAAACGSATSGAFVIDATTTSTVVSTTSVTANSLIFLQEDSSLGTRLSVTCNTQSSLTLGALRVTARTAGTSFTATIEAGPTTNPMCVSYFIVN